MNSQLNFDNLLDEYDCGELAPESYIRRYRRRCMRYLITYDICHPKRLRRVARTCEDFGVRMQKSVFECDLDPAYFKLLWDALAELVVEDEDFIGVYTLCSACRERVQTMGRMGRPDLDSALIC